VAMATACASQWAARARAARVAWCCMLLALAALSQAAAWTC
jgi:hypothetical protein